MLWTVNLAFSDTWSGMHISSVLSFFVHRILFLRTAPLKFPLSVVTGQRLDEIRVGMTEYHIR
jgi:hypothetical protein